ncbi:hypothetical protein CCZ01_01270 [Helicobacter monodelphidis]|uniref:DUF475 domain-containing protein n=1 Tax=Helicobacter sp. 15-1451 TaxID=2004995 RepID=UPI000DCC31F4|nr:DUF475 domain-containing protein [Helicobacter sp. 15-1451]RAX58854.1 hypothetical protein CCZ01_01270 [Helicobacter sp. 15-1451]
MKYFAFSSFFALAGLVVAFIFLGGVNAAYIVFLLALLEVSISFDNAVINAKVLNTMDEKWRFRFITYGIPIAVFGVRFILPIVIVALASSKGFVEITQLALNDAAAYAALLSEVMGTIYAFGGAFLLMVFLEFFFDEGKEISWIKGLEQNAFVVKISKINFIELFVASVVGIILLGISQDISIGIAYFIGLALYALIRGIDNALAKTGAKSGVIGFLYLEVLDASFSLDGVIGAFALSNNVFIIMIGLAIGAFFVRSLTIYFVEKKVLSEFIFLEHGARYAILFLATLMFVQIFHHIPEVIVGSVGMIIIVIAFVHSVIHSKANRK